jgi:hypothetical protein
MREGACEDRAQRCAWRTQFGDKRIVDLEALAMFKVPAYDPVGIAIMGFGVLLVVALAFAF